MIDNRLTARYINNLFVTNSTAIKCHLMLYPDKILVHFTS